MTTESQSAPEYKHLVLPSDPSVLDHVVEVADAFARMYTSDEDLAYRIVLLTSEAVTNAIEHGNKLDPTKEVVVEFSAGKGYLEVAVQDEGTGFDAEVRRDPLAQENLLDEGGRGIFLIESLADEYSYEQGGRKLRMVFRTDAV